MIRLAFSRLASDGSEFLAWELTERGPLDYLLLAGGPALAPIVARRLPWLSQRRVRVLASVEDGVTQEMAGMLRAADTHARVAVTAWRSKSELVEARILARALDGGADVVLTGEGMAESLAAAAAMHHYGWAEGQFGRVAGASLAGHILASGPLACGGGAGADWQTLSSPASIDGPIVAIDADGALTITRHAGSGGDVSRPAVIEALVAGVADPRAFDTPDCRIDLSELEVLQGAPGSVQVRGARGAAPVMRFEAVRRAEGWRVTAFIVYAAPAALEKAYAADRLLRERVALMRLEVEEISGEFLGASPDAPQVVWRVAARCGSATEAEALANEIPAVVRRGPPGGVIPSGAGAPLVEQISLKEIRPVPRSEVPR